MKNIIFLLSYLALQILVNPIFAQEKGNFKKNPKINVKDNTGIYKEKKKKDLLDELPTLQFKEEVVQANLDNDVPFVENINFSGQSFDPRNPINGSISSFDTTSMNESVPMVVEVEEVIEYEGSEDMTTVASYFSVWDSKSIDPYDIDSRDLQDVVELELFNKDAGRYWSVPCNVPINGRAYVTSQFGARWGRMHAGVDLELETGDPVYAAFDGIVRVNSYNGSGYGNFLVIRHYNGLETLYGHLSSKHFESGTHVKAGDEIGLGGNTGRSTGSHLHFETRYEGNPLNPSVIFNFRNKEPVAEKVLISSRSFSTYGDMKNEYEEDQPNIKRISHHFVLVQRGETLYSIAAKADISPERLAKLNGMKVSSTLKYGKRLRIR
ncbi:MAG: peptidoglycan DD-metalloendopeptidase family protein [Pseudarcicella sp.]|nr:peptidoglycan DD-metalloendopeptidase family protein [Pseudarcicella sp.]MBP6411178.1 peptidoglycan DD-metalloendopeptidase family protein [Pseudarcicella sp.]